MKLKNSLVRSSEWVKEYWPFLFLFGITFLFHLCYRMDNVDDKLFRGYTLSPDFNLWSFSVDRYTRWGSRQLIEALVFPSVILPPVFWVFMDSLVFTAIGLLISKLILVESNKLALNSAIVLSLLVFNYYDVGSAGWVVTTINYMWPLAFGLGALLPLVNLARGKTLKIWDYLLSTILLLIAAQCEQMCLIFLTVLGFILVYLIWKKRGVGFVSFLLFVCLLSLTYILLCPGNSRRVADETANWLPQFATFNLFQKVEIGLSLTLSKLFLSTNVVFTVLTFLLFLLNLRLTQGVHKKILSGIPFFSVILFNILYYSSLFPGFCHSSFNTLFDTISAFGVVNSPLHSTRAATDLLCLLCLDFALVLASVYFLFGNGLESLVICGLLLVGFGSKVVIGFSPTAWASSDRTGIFLIFAIILCIGLVLKKKWDFTERFPTQVLLTLFGVLAVSSITLTHGLKIMDTLLVKLPLINERPLVTQKDPTAGLSLSQNQVVFHLERVNTAPVKAGMTVNTDTGLELFGWSVGLPNHPSVLKAYLKIGSTFFPFSPVSRIDVANMFSVTFPSDLSFGLVLNIAPESLPKGGNPGELILVDNTASVYYQVDSGMILQKN